MPTYEKVDKKTRGQGLIRNLNSSIFIKRRTMSLCPSRICISFMEFACGPSPSLSLSLGTCSLSLLSLPGTNPMMFRLRPRTVTNVGQHKQLLPARSAIFCCCNFEESSWRHQNGGGARRNSVRRHYCACKAKENSSAARCAW